MKSNKVVIFTIISIVAIALVALLVTLYLTDKDGEAPAISADAVSDTQNNTCMEESLDTTPKPIPELDEGNEIYLDADVIARLTEMELYGEEDLVNAILDGEMVLINSFVNKGYSLRAVRQAQRFYFHFYDDLKNESIESVVGKLTSCFTTEGVFENSFSADAKRLFGFAADTDYSYIFDMEDSQ